MQSKVGVALGVVAVVLAIVAVAGPWWSMNMQASALGLTVTGDAHFGLFGGTATVTTPAGSTSNSSDYKNSPHVGSVFTLATVLLVLGMLLGIGMVVLAAMPGSKPSSRRVGAILGVLAFLLVLLAPLYVMSALPGAVNLDSGAGTSLATVSGFWGSKSSGFLGVSAAFSYGADWGWYVALVAAIVFLVGGAAILLARKPAAMPPMAMPPPPSP